MAEIIKAWTQQNKTDLLVQGNEIIKKRQLKKIWSLRIILLVLTVFCLGGYYFKLSANYIYFLYGTYLSGGLLLLSFLIIRSELQSYHNYHIEQEGELAESKREKFKLQLQQILTADRLRVINNIYLPCSTSYLYQIDEVIVSQQNIYIVKFTDWSGVVEGMSNVEQWQNQQHEKFNNPYQANQSNVEALQKIVFEAVPNEKINFYNVVINLERNFNYNIPDRANYPIFDNLYQGLYWIKRQEHSAQQILSEEEQEQIINNIMAQHASALQEAELNLNKKLLQQYNIYQKFKES